MYSRTTLKQPALGEIPGMAKQAISSATSMIANYAAASATIGAFAPIAFGSMVGPIGTIVGAVVSLLMAIFGGGKPPKKPIYGLIAIVPEPEKDLSVGRLLDILTKRMIYGAWGFNLPGNIPAITAMGKTIKANLDATPRGCLSVQSGGLSSAHDDVNALDYAKLLSYTSGLAKPFTDTLSYFKPEIVQAMLSEKTQFKASSQYYFWIGENQAGVEQGGGMGGGKNKWSVSGISQAYNAVLINQGSNLKATMDKAFKSLPEALNLAWINHVGMDIIGGTVTDPVKLKAAIKPNPVASITQAISSPLGLIALAAGAILLTDRRV